MAARTWLLASGIALALQLGSCLPAGAAPYLPDDGVTPYGVLRPARALNTPPAAPATPAPEPAAPAAPQADAAPAPEPLSLRHLVEQRALAHGAAPGVLVRLVQCESRFDPSARGDRGRSHGLAQLNDLPTGLIWHFYAAGYTDAYDAWQAADYLAQVAAGRWARQGVTLRRWSCYR